MREACWTRVLVVVVDGELVERTWVVGSMAGRRRQGTDVVDILPVLGGVVVDTCPR